MILRPWWLLLYQVIVSCQPGLAEKAPSCDTCSVSLLCWAKGGVSIEGECGGPSWLYSCCLEGVNRIGPFRQAFRFIDSSEEESDEQENYEKNEIGPFQFTTAHQQFLRNLGIRPAPFRNQIPASPPVPNRHQARSPHHQLIGSHSHIIQQPARNVVQRSSQKPTGIQYHPNQATMLTMSGTYVPAQCGIQPLKSGIQKRIIGGSQAVFGEYPWQAHIRIAGFQCGGVLVNRQYIATAAHCVHRAKLSQIVVYLGEYDTRDTEESIEPLPKETLGVTERKIHPRFQYMLTQPDRFDVALLKLSRPVQYRENILPICLPPPGKDYETAVGVVAGWGKTDTSFGKTGTNILQKVYVPIINNAECYGWHERKGIVLELHEEMFCAGHEMGQMDACLGDSGGPLVVNEGGRWTLVGITSAGFGCAVDHQPGIYHKVSMTVGWIIANILD